MISIIKDNLTVKVCDSRAEMGKLAATEAANVLRQLLAKKEFVNMIFAAAPSRMRRLKLSLPPSISTGSA